MRSIKKLKRPQQVNLYSRALCGWCLDAKAWLESARVPVRAVNLYSLGAHTRRSRLLYQKAFGSRVKVGAFAHPDNSYDPKRWWASSEGFRKVLDEGIAYLYARALFHP